MPGNGYWAGHVYSLLVRASKLETATVQVLLAHCFVFVLYMCVVTLHLPYVGQ